MTTSNEEQLNSPALGINEMDNSENKPSSNLGTKPPLKTKTNLLFSFFITALVLGGSSYAIYENLQLRKNFLQQNEQLATALHLLKEQQTNRNISFTQRLETIQQSQNSLEKDNRHLNASLHRLLQQSHFQKEDWLLVKAHYYLELAQINTFWESDLQTALALLQQADQILLSLNNPQIFNVRQAISEEIVAIKAVEKVDLAGLLSRLNAATEQLSNLPLKQHSFSVMGEASENGDTKKPLTWKEKLVQNMALLKHLVVVTHHDKIQPQLSPLHQALQRDLVRMNLQEAQWAVLQHNNEVYQLALTQAKTSLLQGFEEKDAVTQALLEQLQQLKQEKITLPKLQLDKSLILLNQMIETNAQPHNSSTSTTGEPQ